jgi:serine/threonine protein kinase
MGVVYEAKQLSLNRTVAVKVLPFAAALDPRQLQRFKNEAQAAASLHHEHIVPVYFVGCERGVHFYAMQYIEGLSLAAIIKELRTVIKQGPTEPEQTGPYLPPLGATPTSGSDTSALAGLTTEGSIRSRGFFERVARLGVEAAKGLDHAHQEYVLHRDIKPANLLVDGRGSLWITDFGLAQMRSDTQLTMTGELVGTLRYMSPEQALAKRVPVDQRTDIYSLGATLYELLTLAPVFRGKDRQDLLRQIAFDDPKPPRRLNHHIPRDLETIVLTSLAKAPANRYASARELAEDLQRFLDDQPIKARPEGALRWLQRKSRRHASSLALGLSVVLTSVVLLILLLYLSRPSPEEEDNKRQQQALAALNGELDLKRRVILIPEHGRPGYYRWICNEKHGKISLSTEGEFTVENWEHGLLELLPDPRLERYRFSAEVCHEKQANHESIVGIYFTHSRHPDGESFAHFHCNVAFNDKDDVGPRGENGVHPGNALELIAQRQPPDGRVYHRAYVEIANVFHFNPAKKPPNAFGPWRRISVEIRPETISTFWEGKCIAATSRANLVNCARDLGADLGLNNPLAADSPWRQTGGGLGLYLSMGVASFRNVSLEPIN